MVVAAQLLEPAALIGGQKLGDSLFAALHHLTHPRRQLAAQGFGLATALIEDLAQQFRLLGRQVEMPFEPRPGTVAKQRRWPGRLVERAGVVEVGAQPTTDDA